MTNKENTGGLLSVKVAAAALGISERKVWSLIYSRALAHVRIGRSVKIRPLDLEKFIEDRLVGSIKGGWE